MTGLNPVFIKKSVDTNDVASGTEGGIGRQQAQLEDGKALNLARNPRTRQVQLQDGKGVNVGVNL